MRRSIALLANLLVLACGGGGGGTDRRTLVDSRDNYDPRSLDPALSTDVPTGRAVGYLFDGLTRFTPDAKVIPALATSWETSADGLTYTFHLRRGVTFTDGTPLVARQVLASWQRVLDPKVRGGRGWPLYPIRGAKEFADGKATTIEGLSAPNDSTLVVTLKEPFAIFPKLLAMPVASIAPERVPANFGEHPVGTGPWRLVDWKHDDYLLFAPNERYWGGRPKADSPAIADLLMADAVGGGQHPLGRNQRTAAAMGHIPLRPALPFGIGILIDGVNFRLPWCPIGKRDGLFVGGRLSEKRTG